MAPVSSDATSVRALALLGGAVSGALGLSGAALAVATVLHAAWFAVAFEAMIAIAGVVGVAWGLRQPGAHTAIALLYVAATIFVASVLSYIGAGRVIAGVSLTPLLAGRLAADAALAALAGAIVVVDRPAWALRRLGLGLALIAAPTGVVAVLWLAPNVRSQLASLNPAVLAALGALAFTLIVGMLSAGVHLLITTFTPPSRDRAPTT